MRLIDADKLNARLSRNGTPYFTVCDIDNAPTVDAAPVVHARWVYIYWCEFKCSNCGNLSKSTPIKGKEKYCSNCGAKMDGR